VAAGSSSTANTTAYAADTHCRSDRLARRSRWIDGSATLTTVMSSSNMNAAVQTSTSVHRCRDDVPGASAICLTTSSGSPSRLTHRGCQNSSWYVSSTWGWVGVDASRETTCPPAPWYRPEPPVIGSVKFSDRLTIVPWVVICPPGRIEVVGHWASTLAALAVDTNVLTTPTG
jgi:hypothetical protein